MNTPTTDLRAQFENRLVMVLREHRRTVDRSPAATCNALYWISRLYPQFGTNDVAEVLAEHHSPALARAFVSWRFWQIVGRA